MRKIILLLFVILLLFTLVACAKDTPTTQTPDTTIIASPETSLSTSPTPKPTLSEEELRIHARYNELMEYCQNYNDWYAAILIKNMYDEGEIDDKDFSAIYNLKAFQDTKDFDDNVWDEIKSHLENISLIINGKLSELNEADMKSFYEYMCSSSQQDTIYYNLFDSQDKIDRIKTGISLIDYWFHNPTEDYFGLFEELFLSEDLTPGEAILLSSYIYYNPHRPIEATIESGNVDIDVYLNQKGVMERTDKAYDDLFKLNNN